MLDRRRFVRTAVFGAAAGRLAAASAQEAQWPNGGIIKAIAMFPPGSGADVKIRFYSDKLAKKLGATVVVENKPGAMGYIATEYVARSRPDGFTIYIAPGSSMLAAAPVLFKNLRFDPINDFEHITTLNFSAFVLAVSGKSPIKSIAELTAALKKKGTSGSYASIAPPSVAFGETYKQKAGLETVEIKYKDQGPLIVDVINGVVDFTTIDVITIAGLIKDGRLRPLAMASAERLKSIPEIPGAAEAGIPGLDIKNWWSVHVPKGTPKAICDRLETLFNEIAVEPDTLQFLKDNGSDPLPGNSKSLRELLVKDTANWKEYAKIAHIAPI
jgi:tripartite-type tricarboxylate transporter receptor subunit TctC